MLSQAIDQLMLMSHSVVINIQHHLATYTAGYFMHNTISYVNLAYLKGFLICGINYKPDVFICVSGPTWVASIVKCWMNLAMCMYNANNQNMTSFECRLYLFGSDNV